MIESFRYNTQQVCGLVYYWAPRSSISPVLLFNGGSLQRPHNRLLFVLNIATLQLRDLQKQEEQEDCIHELQHHALRYLNPCTYLRF